MALVNAISGEPENKGPSTAASPSGGGGKASPTRSGAATSPTAVLPLVIKVTGQPTGVVVRVADTAGKVLTNDTLNTGVTLQYEEAPLSVVADNGGALQVTIYGKVQEPKPNGQRGVWLVKAKG
ncbi:RodZ domain-containing protein [Actinomadura darangshiensis]|nr:RodZ domain-containing protein [Actinomadura darangshiensis]